MFKKSFSIILAIIIMLGILTGLPVSVTAQVADIADGGTNLDLAETGNPYSGGYANCTWTAWKCAYDDGYHLPDYSWGDAWQWYGSAQRDGYHCDKTPSAHSIIVYNYTSTNSHGHVAYVVDYNSANNMIYVKEGGYLGGYHDGWISAYGANLLGYIHLDGNPEPEILRVNVTGSQAYLNWDWDHNAAYYKVKIWQNKIWEGDAYRVVWAGNTNNYGFALPKGTYQAYVDACNDNSGYCKMSNVITFTIGDVGVNLDVAIYGSQVTFNWNSDNSPNYSLKVFKEFTWDGELYENIQPLTKTSYTLGLPKGRYQAYVDCNSMSNVVDFSVGEETPKLSANVQGNQVYFNWNADNKANSYNLKIYKGHVWQVDAYEIINNITQTTAGVALPSGTYQAYVDAVGNNYLHMGSVIQFTVGNSEPVLSAKVTGNQVDFSWTNDNKARSYALKIWSGHAWKGNAYLVKNIINDTNVTVMLPKGNYQAYIDAFEDNNTVMGNVIDISITENNYVEPTEPPTTPPTNPPTEPPTNPPTTPPTEPPTAAVIKLGDVDGDDEVTIIDATCIQRKLASIPTAIFIEEAADADEDGELSIIDATVIQRWLAQFSSNDNIGKPIA